MKKRGGLPGRPCKAEKPRTRFRAVRLSDAEIEAIKTLEISFADLVRNAIAQAVSEKKNAA